MANEAYISAINADALLCQLKPQRFMPHMKTHYS